MSGSKKLPKPNFNGFLLFIKTGNEVSFVPEMDLDLILRSASVLDDFCCFLQNLLEHCFNIPMDDTVTFDTADTIAHVVENLALHG